MKELKELFKKIDEEVSGFIVCGEINDTHIEKVFFSSDDIVDLFPDPDDIYDICISDTGEIRYECNHNGFGHLKIKALTDVGLSHICQQGNALSLEDVHSKGFISAVKEAFGRSLYSRSL